MPFPRAARSRLHPHLVGARPCFVLRAPRVPRRLRARARHRAGALRPLPRGVGGPARQDPGPRRLAPELRRSCARARSRPLSDRPGTGRARGGARAHLAAAATCSLPCSRRRSPPSISSTASSAVEAAVVEAFDERIEYARSGHVDNKTELQEALARSGNQVQYIVLEVEGPPHDRRFVCAVMIAGEQVGIGRGSTKKAAEQEAARQALEAMGRPGLTASLRRQSRPRRSVRDRFGLCSALRGQRRRRPAARARRQRVGPSVAIGKLPACTFARSSCAASSRSSTRSSSSSSPASPSSSARTGPASRTSPTRSSGRQAR